MIIFNDMTSRVQSVMLKNHEKVLQEKLDALENLTSTISHEFRTPL